MFRPSVKKQFDLPDDVVLSVHGVSKIFCRSLLRSMAYGIRDLTLSFAGICPERKTLRFNEFMAVDNISFDLRRGEALGLIGPNGSGKTTLLRLISGIFPPDRGRIARRGRMVGLIALGAGFHPHMTGRENIYLNGAILGMKRHEVDEKLQDIIDFAEIGEFLDAPVATYSSGMRVRLGFAIAAHINPDILVVDEVLAVGDARFQRKCVEHLRKVRESGAAFILVSHNMQTIEASCDRAILLDKGLVVAEGAPGSVVAEYDMRMRPDVSRELSSSEESGRNDGLKLIKKYRDFESGEVKVLSVWLETSDGVKTSMLDDKTDAVLKIKYRSNNPGSLQKGFLSISFINEYGVVCLGSRLRLGEKVPESGVITVRLGKSQLTTSRYSIAVHFFDYAFTVPFWTSHYGYIEAKQDVPTGVPGENTPYCWADWPLNVERS